MTQRAARAAADVQPETVNVLVRVGARVFVVVVTGDPQAVLSAYSRVGLAAEIEGRPSAAA